MYVGKAAALASVLTFLTALPAFAQGPSTTGRPSTAEPRWYLAGFVGAVAGASTEPAFGVEIAQEIHPRVQAYFTFSYLENVMRRTLSDELDEAAVTLTALTGTRWAFDGRDRGLALSGGGKYLFGNGAVRPYLGGGAGVIKVTRRITEARLGDVTVALYNDFGIGDSDLSLAPEGLTRPLGEVVAGVGFVTGRAYFDIGYRYRAAFRLENQLDFSQVTVGIGYRF